MHRIFRLSVFLFLPGIVLGFPLTMDIGTYTIDNYLANGNGLSNLSYQIASGQNFVSAASANMPSYVSFFSGGTRGPTQAVDLRDTQVTKSAITSTDTSLGSREYCDFVFYGGHGLAGGLYLGADPNYGPVLPSELRMGGNGSLGFNKWLFAGSCLLFNVSSPAATWAPAFRGLRAMLAFKSAIFDNNQSGALYNDFWLNWTWKEMSLQLSFFTAELNYGYAHLYPMAGLEPGCLSAQPPANHRDYCRESFRNTDNHHLPAIMQTGTFTSCKIGSPIY